MEDNTTTKEVTRNNLKLNQVQDKQVRPEAVPLLTAREPVSRNHPGPILSGETSALQTLNIDGNKLNDSQVTPVETTDRMMPLHDSIFGDTLDLQGSHQQRDNYHNSNQRQYQPTNFSVQYPGQQYSRSSYSQSNDVMQLLRLNEAAMTAMRIGQMTAAQQALKACEQMLKQPDKVHDMTLPDKQKIRALTFNNLGCYYRKVNRPLIALNYMELSLRADIANRAPQSHLASTKLNICAVLSTLKRHAEARKLAEEAVRHLVDTISELQDEQEAKQMGLVGQSILCSTITVALFNLGAEHEHLNDLQEALFAYQKSRNFAKKGGFQALESQAAEAIVKVETKLLALQEKLAKRSRMRESKAASRYFQDDSHILEIELERRHREQSQQERRSISHQQIGGTKNQLSKTVRDWKATKAGASGIKINQSVQVQMIEAAQYNQIQSNNQSHRQSESQKQEGSDRGGETVLLGEQDQHADKVWTNQRRMSKTPDLISQNKELINPKDAQQLQENFADPPYLSAVSQDLANNSNSRVVNTYANNTGSITRLLKDQGMPQGCQSHHGSQKVNIPSIIRLSSGASTDQHQQQQLLAYGKPNYKSMLNWQNQLIKPLQTSARRVSRLSPLGAQQALCPFDQTDQDNMTEQSMNMGLSSRGVSVPCSRGEPPSYGNRAKDGIGKRRQLSRKMTEKHGALAPLTRLQVTDMIQTGAREMVIKQINQASCQEQRLEGGDMSVMLLAAAAKKTKRFKQELQHPQIKIKSNTSMDSEMMNSDIGSIANKPNIINNEAAFVEQQLFRASQLLSSSKTGSKTPVNNRKNNTSSSTSRNRQVLQSQLNIQRKRQELKEAYESRQAVRSDMQFMRTTTEFPKQHLDANDDKRLLSKLKNQRANSLLETQQQFNTRPYNRLDKLHEVQQSFARGGAEDTIFGGMDCVESAPQRFNSADDDSMFTLRDRQQPSPIPYNNNNGLAFRNYQKLGCSTQNAHQHPLHTTEMSLLEELNSHEASVSKIHLWNETATPRKSMQQQKATNSVKGIMESSEAQQKRMLVKFKRQLNHRVLQQFATTAQHRSKAYI